MNLKEEVPKNVEGLYHKIVLVRSRVNEVLQKDFNGICYKMIPRGAETGNEKVGCSRKCIIKQPSGLKTEARRVRCYLLYKTKSFPVDRRSVLETDQQDISKY